MKNRFYIYLSLILFLSFFCYCENNIQVPKKIKNDYIPFYFKQESILNIIDIISKKKNINIILPQLPADKSTLSSIKVSYTNEENKFIDIDKAFRLLSLFLDMSGFSIFKKSNNLYQIVKSGLQPNEENVLRENLDLYVNVDPKELPKTEERIRYIYFFKYLKVPNTQNKANDPIFAILKDLLSSNSTPIFDTANNAVIISDKSNLIAYAIFLLSELDKSGFKEVIEIVNLEYVNAKTVIQIFSMLKKATGEIESSMTKYSKGSVEEDSISYLASDTKIVSDLTGQAVILMGKENAVSKIRSFIHSHIDLPEDSGRSILHVYELQYLDAQSFKNVLEAVVNSGNGSQQSTQSNEGYFQGVVIEAEESQIKEVTPREGSIPTEKVDLQQELAAIGEVGIKESKTFVGGNRLLIAAKHDDWIRIKDFIELLDRPEPQVILEVVIADLTATKNKLVGAEFRNLTDSVLLSSGFQYLSSPLGSVNNALGDNPTQLAQDLLIFTTSSLSPANTLGAFNNTASQGSMLISFNDPKTPGIFGLLQVFQQFVNTRILTHPFLITTTNQKATIADVNIIRSRGDAIPSASGTVTIKIDDIAAAIQVEMIPKISSYTRLNLQIAVDIIVFETSASSTSPTSLTRTNRRVNTSANMSSGEILVIGGLTQEVLTDTEYETPILAKIPLIGQFFRYTNRIIEKVNINIFISPTIIRPKLRAGVDLYTQDKVKRAYRDLSDDVMFGDNNKDPIIYLFFNEKKLSDFVLKQYVSDSELSKNDEKNLKKIKRSEKHKQNVKRKLRRKKEKVEIKKNIENQKLANKVIA